MIKLRLKTRYKNVEKNFILEMRDRFRRIEETLLKFYLNSFSVKKLKLDKKVKVRNKNNKR